MDSRAIMGALIQRGYTPVQAAALAGNIQQESSGDPNEVNAPEDSHGLIQWRLDRWDNLRNFAAQQGKSPNDPNVQLDFIGHEMRGSESGPGSRFLAAQDLPSAQSALKSYIRWGDNSDQKRVSNASQLLGQGPINTPLTSARTALGNSGSEGSAPGGSAPSVSDTEPGSAAAIASIAKQLAQQDQTTNAAPAMPPLRMAEPSPVQIMQMQRARQLAQAMLAQSLNPGGPT